MAPKIDLPDYYRCGFTVSQLEGLVAKMRGIAQLEGDSALALADIVAWDIIQMHEEVEVLREEEQDEPDVTSWDLDEAKDAVEELRNEIREIEGYLKSGDIETYHGEQLRSSVESGRIRKDLSTLGAIGVETMQKWQELEARALELADRVEIEAHVQEIKVDVVRDIASIASVKAIIRDSDAARSYLEGKGLLTDELRAMARQAQERACWHRARKKLAELEIAEAGGNIKKSVKLRAEAEVLIRQDSMLAFPDETAPSIEAPTLA